MNLITKYSSFHNKQNYSLHSIYMQFDAILGLIVHPLNVQFASIEALIAS